MRKILKHITYLLLFVLLLAPEMSLVFAQDLAPESKQDEQTEAEVVVESEEVEALEAERLAREEKLQSLRSILLTLANIEGEVLVAQKELRSAAGQGREKELKGTIESLSKHQEVLRQNFEIIASEVEVGNLEADQISNNIEWGEELKELLAPLMREVKTLTSRPREIERLRSAISAFQERIEKIGAAKTNVNRLRENAQSPAVLEQLERLGKVWEEKEIGARTELSIRNQKLQQLLGEKKTLGESVREIFDLFFRSRGRNLVLALFATIVFFIAIRRFFAWMQRISPFHRGELSYRVRLFNVLFLAFSGAGALVVFMVVLFFFGDWVLLTLALMFLLGVAWSSKQAIPRFWGQALLLLNMGPVREGERIEYLGVPWEVVRLNYYSILKNPRLSNGRLRLPIEDLSELRSRQTDKHEPWFPTEVGNWVLLGDDTYGKVLTQTPELVQLVLQGGSRKTYRTADFIEQNPEVLSSGFRHSISFGIDYGHQAGSTEEIPNLLKQFVLEMLTEHGYSKEDFSLKVEFEAAGASSLNIAVIADFDGSFGQKYQELQRLLNRLCVQACNQHGWVIPFDQLTLHVPQALRLAGSSV